MSTYTAIAAGEMSAVSADIERITGQRAMTLAELLAAQSLRRAVATAP